MSTAIQYPVTAKDVLWINISKEKDKSVLVINENLDIAITSLKEEYGEDTEITVEKRDISIIDEHMLYHLAFSGVLVDRIYTSVKNIFEVPFVGSNHILADILLD